jgi:hypothetical protein
MKMKPMNYERILKQGENKGLATVARLLLLATCAKSQENRFDLHTGKAMNGNEPTNNRQ